MSQPDADKQSTAVIYCSPGSAGKTMPAEKIIVWYGKDAAQIWGWKNRNELHSDSEMKPKKGAIVWARKGRQFNRAGGGRDDKKMLN